MHHDLRAGAWVEQSRCPHADVGPSGDLGLVDEPGVRPRGAAGAGHRRLPAGPSDVRRALEADAVGVARRRDQKLDGQRRRRRGQRLGAGPVVGELRLRRHFQRLPAVPPPRELRAAGPALTPPTSLRPFAIHVDDADVEDLRDRLARTRWPGPATTGGWDQGPPLDYLYDLC